MCTALVVGIGALGAPVALALGCSEGVLAGVLDAGVDGAADGVFADGAGAGALLAGVLPGGGVLLGVALCPLEEPQPESTITAQVARVRGVRRKGTDLLEQMYGVVQPG